MADLICPLCVLFVIVGGMFPTETKAILSALARRTAP